MTRVAIDVVSDWMKWAGHNVTKYDFIKCNLNFIILNFKFY